MKYIRTKDGRILKNGVEERKLGIRNGKGYEILIADINKFREADTIEELCDEFVVCLKDGDKLLMDGDVKSARDFLFGYGGLRKTECVYGAIWTDKGLIYVAKMNNEGELELL